MALKRSASRGNHTDYDYRDPHLRYGVEVSVCGIDGVSRRVKARFWFFVGDVDACAVIIYPGNAARWQVVPLYSVTITHQDAPPMPKWAGSAQNTTPSAR